MLATEWCVPGQGSTVQELLDWGPSYLVDTNEFHQLTPFLKEKTNLRIVHPEEGGEYDITRIREALRKIREEPELCVILVSSLHGGWLEHGHFGGGSDMRHKDLLEWVSGCDVFGEDEGPLRISLTCPEVEEEIIRMEDSRDPSLSK
jgi:hypothetical protein